MLNLNFYEQPTLDVAQTLLGKVLVRDIEGQRLRGIIVETEAYIGHEDTACHASKGRTPRTEVMFGPAGQTYVYLIYGMYWMLNVVTEAVDFPAAVLIRALEPTSGLEAMSQNRRLKKPTTRVLTNGPGKLCQALQIDDSLNKWDLSRGQALWIEAQHRKTNVEIACGPRINIDFAEPKDRNTPWRFWIKDNPFVSK